ncbi:hypothetical protein BGP79_05745 [Tersicoccus sp. Bi-70]|nr:hypothetical protein BGP79_05745 [Tersicoccus sp. Bi-70]
MLLESVDPTMPSASFAETPDGACTLCWAEITDDHGFDGLCSACLTDACSDCLAALTGDEGVDDGRCHACVDAAA